MRKDEPNAVDSSSNNGAAATQPQSSSRAESTRHELTRSWPMLQFFIKTISGGNTLVIQAHAHDSVKTLHERIEAITRIPATEQRLIYRGKQLQWEQSLARPVLNPKRRQLAARRPPPEHSPSSGLAGPGGLGLGFFSTLPQRKGARAIEVHQEPPQPVLGNGSEGEDGGLWS
ncbi:E3 ubiquitin-protein ligase UPL5-like [Rosa chinensis]|uniref:E3 ubiquitin-protein ligase UPL5-like n=1 Tax=Rosa chinensis TaxID=74649 RepID=UPI000D09498E|nr:E3 ubiquitin-protein ligase UPL5-like [Rosa chinensis]